MRRYFSQPVMLAGLLMALYHICWRYNLAMHVFTHSEHTLSDQERPLSVCLLPLPAQLELGQSQPLLSVSSVAKTSSSLSLIQAQHVHWTQDCKSSTVTCGLFQCFIPVELDFSFFFSLSGVCHSSMCSRESHSWVIAQWNSFCRFAQSLQVSPFLWSFVEFKYLKR